MCISVYTRVRVCVYVYTRLSLYKCVFVCVCVDCMKLNTLSYAESYVSSKNW